LFSIYIIGQSCYYSIDKQGKCHSSFFRLTNQEWPIFIGFFWGIAHFYAAELFVAGRRFSYFWKLFTVQSQTPSDALHSRTAPTSHHSGDIRRIFTWALGKKERPT